MKMAVLNYKVTAVFANILEKTVFSIGIRPACAGWLYQPKVPKHLKK